jgi:hypothetical protein
MVRGTEALLVFTTFRNGKLSCRIGLSRVIAFCPYTIELRRYSRLSVP